MAAVGDAAVEAAEVTEAADVVEAAEAAEATEVTEAAEAEEAVTRTLDGTLNRRNVGVLNPASYRRNSSLGGAEA